MRIRVVNSLLKEKYAISVYLRSIKEDSPSSKFPECKQMIFWRLNFSNCFFIFFRYLYLTMDINGFDVVLEKFSFDLKFKNNWTRR